MLFRNEHALTGWRFIKDRWCAAIIMLLFVVSAGCQHAATSSAETQNAVGRLAGADDEGKPITPADVPMPADYTEAVARLCEYRDDIREAISSGHLHDAHRPLDETNITLERLPAIARSSGVRRRDWEVIVVAGDDLGEALAEIDAALDAGQSPDYASHAKAIDEALGRLQGISERDAAHYDKSAEE